MSIKIIHGNALALPIEDNTVDLVVTSPPYFGLRSYTDNGEHYEGQIGSEATPAEFVDALIAATREMVRVLKPSGSIWVNLGDKMAGSTRHMPTHRGNVSEHASKAMSESQRANVDDITTPGIRPKSLIGIPWRYALRCIDELGLILRAEVIWAKNNGLPESVQDRVRRSHEQWFYFQPSSGEVVERPSQRLPFCPLCGRPVDPRASLISRLHEIDTSIEDGDLPDKVGTDERVKSESGVSAEQPRVVGLGGAAVPLPVPGDADLIEDSAHLLHDGKVAVVDDDSEVRAPSAAMGERDRALSVDDSSEPREVCSCSHPFIIQDEPWIPQSLAAELMQMVANGEADAQNVADFLSGDYARTHSTWFHFTLNPRYYSAVDEVREPHLSVIPGEKSTGGTGYEPHMTGHMNGSAHPLGKLPGSVWTIPTQPLRVPAHLGIDHFAAFPMEWPRRIITGWSPREVCTVCGEGRRPVVVTSAIAKYGPGLASEMRARSVAAGGVAKSTLGPADRQTTITGYACDCPDTSAPAAPGVVLDPFGGTGTTALVADVLGRDAIHVDLSADYCRLAEWRTTDPGERARAMQVEKPAAVIDGQGDLLEGLTA